MTDPVRSDVTVLLSRVRAGDDSAKGDLLELTYSQLRGLAAGMFRDQPADHTLQPTALVNELCARFLTSDAASWEDRNHFFRAAARAMRILLTDHARAKRATRRGGARTIVALSEVGEPAAPEELDLVALDETLAQLTALDERLGLIFELRFLAGIPVDTTAEICGVSPRTVELDTRFIRAWLQKELSR